MIEGHSQKTYLRVEMGGRVFALRHGELTDDDGNLLPLRAKSAKMLEFLIANHGRVISKDDLAAAVWPGVVATDESIAQCVTDIRKALGDEGHRIVETFPKRGYRLNVTFPGIPVSRPWLPLAILFLVSVLAAASIFLVSGRAPLAPTPNERQVIAVLPFANSIGEDFDYLAVGLAEELIIQLSEISGFSVVPSSRSFTFAGREDAVPAAAQELDADYILSGHLRNGDGEPKATVELIHAASGTNLWAARFGTDPEEVSRFHNEVASEVAKAMKLDLTPADLAHLARQKIDNPDALDLVLRGRTRANTFTLADNLAAEKMFRTAIDLDENYARAYAELAAVYAIRLENNWAVLNSADQERALYFGQKSIELDPDLWLGHYALGRLYSLTDIDDIANAERHLRRAMSLRPDDDDARMYFAGVQVFKGNAEVARRINDEVMASNPEPKFWYYLNVGHVGFHMGLHEEAAEALEQCLTQMPGAPYCLRFQIANFGEMGRIDDAEWALAEYEALGFDTSLEGIIATLPELHPDYAAKMRAALIKAGVR